MSDVRPTFTWLKKLHLLVGMLAVAIKIAIPIGYMVAPQALAAGLTPIVLCTAQGNVTAFMDGDGQILAHGDEALAAQDDGLPSDHDSQSCSFAGHGTPLTAPVGAIVAVAFQAELNVARETRTAVAPGLGLAAPPPPKTGPPIQV